MTQPSSTVRAEEAAVVDETLAVARRYAEALVNAAENLGNVDATLDEMTEIQEAILKKYPRFAALLASARVSIAHKDRILVDLFKGRTSDLVLRFLRVLNRHGRLALFDIVRRESRVLWDRRNRRIPVRVSSAVPLDEARVQSIRDSIASLTGATPILHVSTDPVLIGGLVVQIGDHVYDASVKNRLAQLRKRLIEGKTHEIQSRRDQFSYPA
jgi:F-type H+-transporting ATPase subunit delta